MNFRSLTKTNFQMWRFMLNKTLQFISIVHIFKHIKYFYCLSLHLHAPRPFSWVFKISNSGSSLVFHYQSSQLIKEVTFVNLSVHPTLKKKKKQQVQAGVFLFPFSLFTCARPSLCCYLKCSPSNLSSPGCWLSICR